MTGSCTQLAWQCWKRVTGKFAKRGPKAPTLVSASLASWRLVDEDANLACRGSKRGRVRKARERSLQKLLWGLVVQAAAMEGFLRPRGARGTTGHPLS
eukprot:s5893_g3.t1